MIIISKKESEYIREHAPKIHQVILNKHSNSRKKKRMIQESPDVFRLLNRYRNENVHTIIECGDVGNAKRNKKKNANKNRTGEKKCK